MLRRTGQSTHHIACAGVDGHKTENYRYDKAESRAHLKSLPKNFEAITPANAEQREVTHTAGIMSNGFCAPSAPRTDATVMGISCMEAEFSTMSVHMSFEAHQAGVACDVWQRGPLAWQHCLSLKGLRTCLPIYI